MRPFFLSFLLYSWDRFRPILTFNTSYDVFLCKKVPFWGRVYIAPFWASNTLITPNFRAGRGIFQPNAQNLQTSYYQSQWSDFNQILHNDKDVQLLIVGRPKMRSTNPIWRTAAILKKSLYLSNCLNDFDDVHVI